MVKGPDWMEPEQLADDVTVRTAQSVPRAVTVLVEAVG